MSISVGFPECRINYSWIVHVDTDHHSAGFIIFRQYQFPIFSTIGTAVNAALWIGMKRITHCSYKNNIGIARMHFDVPNSIGFVETDFTPVFTSVYRFVHTVTK